MAEGQKLCLWCGVNPVGPRAGDRYCERKCRQAAWRLRRRRQCFGVTDEPGVFWYFDPGYIGKCAQFYSDQPDFQGEIDHVELISRANAALSARRILGWALSAAVTMESLQVIVPLLPAFARMASWQKPRAVPPTTRGLHNIWEALFIVGGRQLQPGVPDALSASAARSWGDLPGRKPLAFAAWLFDCLGMLPGDTLVDPYVGTGAISRAWREFSPRTATTFDSRTKELVRVRLLPQVGASVVEDDKAQPRSEQLSLLESSTAAATTQPAAAAAATPAGTLTDAQILADVGRALGLREGEHGAA